MGVSVWFMKFPPHSDEFSEGNFCVLLISQKIHTTSGILKRKQSGPCIIKAIWIFHRDTDFDYDFVSLPTQCVTHYDNFQLTKLNSARLSDFLQVVRPLDLLLFSFLNYWIFILEFRLGGPNILIRMLFNQSLSSKLTFRICFWHNIFRRGYVY